MSTLLRTQIIEYLLVGLQFPFYELGISMYLNNLPISIPDKATFCEYHDLSWVKCPLVLKLVRRNGIDQTLVEESAYHQYLLLRPLSNMDGLFSWCKLVIILI